MKRAKDIMPWLAMLTVGVVVGGTVALELFTSDEVVTVLPLVVSAMLAPPVVGVFLSDVYMTSRSKKAFAVFAVVCLSLLCYALFLKEAAFLRKAPFIDETVFLEGFVGIPLFLVLCSLFVPGTLIKRARLAALVTFLGGSAFVLVWALLCSSHLLPGVSWSFHVFNAAHMLIIPVVAVEVGAAKALSKRVVGAEQARLV